MDHFSQVTADYKMLYYMYFQFSLCLRGYPHDAVHVHLYIHTNKHINPFIFFKISGWIWC